MRCSFSGRWISTGVSILVMAHALASASAVAGVTYNLATRPVDQNMALAAPDTPPVVQPFAVDRGNVRVGSRSAKTVYLFKDRIMYVIDNPGRTVHVLRHATLSQVIDHYADAVHQLEQAAARAAPEERADALQKAADMRAVNERLVEPVTRDYRETARFESVDGHACRIWEERENGAKRLELCVAPTASIPGGAEILSGLKTLSQFRQGAEFALGIKFGLTDWWPDFANLGGLPLLVREYRYDSEISEVMLSSMRTDVPVATLWDLPGDYQILDGPDYAQWLIR